MKVELIGHDEKYALEQSLLTLFPGEKPVYGTVDETADAHWVRVTLTEEDERVQVTTELGIDGRSAAHSYDYPLSGTDYEKEGQRRHAVGISFFGAAKDLLGISPAWGSLTGVRPAKVALSLIREGGKAKAERELQELYCVQPARARLAIEAADAGIRAAAELEPNDISLYVGIPFCPTRCAYCSFSSGELGDGKLVEPYLVALAQEIRACGAMMREMGLSVRAAYMGGGTPTSLTAAQLARVLDEAQAAFSGAREWTVEAGRPDSITMEKLRAIRERGVERVCVNPQTFSDETLRRIGRAHTAQDTLRAFALAREAGFAHINMDVIAALPGEDLPQFRATIEQVLALDPESVTVHSLAIKRSSRLHEELVTEKSDYAPPESAAEMIRFARESLRAKGYFPYYLYRQKYMAGNLENTGYAKEGHACLYNIGNMEETAPVLALGAGAVTKWLFARERRIERAPNLRNIEEYIARVAEMVERKRALIGGNGK